MWIFVILTFWCFSHHYILPHYKHISNATTGINIVLDYCLPQFFFSFKFPYYSFFMVFNIKGNIGTQKKMINHFLFLQRGINYATHSPQKIIIWLNIIMIIFYNNIAWKEEGFLYIIQNMSICGLCLCI